jgi:phosphatidylglycerol---prolipoprotein diacylglyceryl transferase
MFTVLSVARVGCFLQGCCYGIRSQPFGLRFARNSVVHGVQVAAGPVDAGAMPLPVVPTQALSAIALGLIAAWSFREVTRLARQPPAPAVGAALFLRAAAAYSAFRFVIEFVRDDPVRNQLGVLSTSQWVALLVVGAFAASAKAGAVGLRSPRSAKTS